MNETFFITETEDGFNLVRQVAVGDVVTSKIVSTHSTITLAEDAVPANAVSSGNIAGVNAGDAPIIRKKRRLNVLRRLINP
jgi:hypothetical protein